MIFLIPSRLRLMRNILSVLQMKSKDVICLLLEITSQVKMHFPNSFEPFHKPNSYLKHCTNSNTLTHIQGTYFYSQSISYRGIVCASMLSIMTKQIVSSCKQTFKLRACYNHDFGTIMLLSKCYSMPQMVPLHCYLAYIWFVFNSIECYTLAPFCLQAVANQYWWLFKVVVILCLWL